VDEAMEEIRKRRKKRKKRKRKKGKNKKGNILFIFRNCDPQILF
jgi:hypothetical protein